MRSDWRCGRSRPRAPILRSSASSPRMAKGRMAEIMHQRHRLRQILVAAQRPCQRPRDLGDFDGVSQPRAENDPLHGQ